MQERRENRLFNLTELQRRTFRLYIARLVELTFQNRGPFLFSPFVFLRRRREAFLTAITS
jgi:hypothetical protein